MRDDVERALGALSAGLAIVMPTDTVYGIAARPDVPGALAAVFAAKGRPEDKALPVLAAGVEDLEAVVVFRATAHRYAAAHWPGPLTLVLERAAGWDYDLGGRDHSTIAVRVPNHAVALELLGRSGVLAVTSANRSGEAPATTVDEARLALGHAVGAFVDGGRLEGSPSTVLALTGEPEVLREGAIPFRDLRV